MNHVSVSPTDGNGPTQGQRKTHMDREKLTWFTQGQRKTHMVHMGLKSALHITLYSVNSV